MEDLPTIFQNFTTQIIRLSNQMKGINSCIGNLSLSLAIPSFSGDSKSFNNWIKCIEKQALLENLDDEGIKRLTFRSSRDAFSDFVQRFLQEHPAENWQALKRELATRFSEVTDQMHAFTLLRTVKQKLTENIQIYAERLLSLGRDSFPPGADRRTIANQLIGFFINGLCQDSLKMKLMRDNPDNFQNAVKIALHE